MVLQVLEISRMIWPKGTAQDALLWVSVALAIAGPVIFIQTRRYYHRAKARERRWASMVRRAVKQGLTAAQIGHLRKFFVTRGNAQVDELLLHREKYRAQLLEFLRQNVNGAARTDVRMFGALFPEAGWSLRIQSAVDLQVGELCSLELAEGTHLGLIIEIVGSDVVLSIPRRNPSAGEIRVGQVGNLFAYRIGVGGFELAGKVVQADRQGIVYRQAGRVQPKGEHHLMANLDMACVLTAWPRKSAALLGTINDPSNSTGGDAAGGIQCKALQVSDRGMIFVTRSAGHILLQKQGVWELRLALEGGYNFVCRGFVSPSKTGNARFYMKFMDVHETGRRVLLQTIMNHAPVQERLG